MGRSGRRKKRSPARHIDAQLAIAREHHAQGRLTDASAVCERLLVRSARRPAVVRLLALICLERGRSFEAIGLLEPLVTADAQDAAALLARAYIDARLFTQAERVLLAAGQREPDNSDVNLQLARLLLHRGEAQRALDHAQLAAASNPDDLDAQLVWCDAQMRVGARFRAQDVLRSLETQEQDKTARQWMALADAAESAGLNDVAQRAWRRAYRADPDLRTELFRLGCQHYSQRDFAQAVHCFRKAWRLAPNDRAVVNSLISALTRISSGSIDADLEHTLLVCLGDERVDPHHLRALATRQLLGKPAIAQLISTSATT